MNDDYDNHILHKYRLAVALAIIKNTPENSNPKQYLEYLKNKIDSKMESYDPDMTICEDDFNFDDKAGNVDDNVKNDKVVNGRNANNEALLSDSHTNDSMTILKDFDFNEMMRNMNNERDAIESNTVFDVLRILKGAENGDSQETEIACGTIDDNKLDHTQSTYYASPQALTQELNNLSHKNVGLTNNNEELAKTVNFLKYNSNKQVKHAINHTKTGITSKGYETYYDSPGTNAFHEHTNCTHISQSQVDNIILPRYLIEKEKPKENKLKSYGNQNKENLNWNAKKTVENGNIVCDGNQISKVMYEKIGTDVVVNNIKVVKDNKKENATQENYDIDKINAKRSRKFNDDKNSDTDTAYFNEIKRKFKMNAIDSNTEMTFNNPIERNELLKKLFVNSDSAVCEPINVINEKIDNDLIKITHAITDKRNNLDYFGSQNSNESNNATNKSGYNSQKLIQFSQEFDSEPTNNNTEANLTIANTAEESKESEEERIIEDLYDELTNSQTEVVPFKVLEELNRVKTFLNRRDKRNSEFVSDSGYRTDSQSRNSFKNALQSSDVWINQSAHCLLSYLTHCPLVLNTEEITKEISRTLGRLIDRLHENEKYPSFLEDHLHTIDNFLKDIHEDESANKLLEKDETIYRLFLLNKSSHVAKYTTEKIITILEDVLTTLTKDELLETSNTIQTENLAYIFHILETLIKKLVVHRNLSSQQSTQNSQEDEGILKKSSITDIWRKKWNPAKKNDLDTVSSVKQCVLVRCTDVLNKLIVQAMDGYSLISYFALQCFNLLQN